MRSAGGKRVAKITNDDSAVATIGLVASADEAYLRELLLQFRRRHEASGAPLRRSIFADKDSASRGGGIQFCAEKWATGCMRRVGVFTFRIGL